VTELVAAERLSRELDAAGDGVRTVMNIGHRC
jgi:hypothetical protein